VITLPATRLVVIRHGQTAWNAQARLQGQLDIPLDALGRRQAATLAEALRHEGLAAVFASDLGRAWHTGRALAAPLGLPLAVDTGLRERCFGGFEGLTRAQIDQQSPELARRWHSREPDFAPVGAESLRVFQARCLAAVERLAAAHAGQAIALVSHGGVLDCLYRAATGLALDSPRSWRLDNASINRLLYTGQGFTLVGWNDAAHLDGLALDGAGD
jgi:probable phosphoglycerate mutase